MKAETFDIYLKPYIHDDLTSNYKEPIWQRTTVSI